MTYDQMIFRVVSNAANGETSTQTIFHYQQVGHVLTGHYSGGRIATGQLLGLVDEAGHLDFHYHQLNVDGELMAGHCRSTPERRATGKIRLHETWQWTTGDRSSGTSMVEEV